jgi:hypothetical protein
MTTDPITQPTTDVPESGEAAPPVLAILAAYGAAVLALALISIAVASTFWHGRALRMALMSVPMIAIMFAPSFIAALMTRRSPLPVTISAAALGMILQPGLLMTRTPGLVSAAIVGTAIWLAAKRLRIEPTDRRRPVGRAMPLRIWMPASAIALGLLPFLARSMSNDPFKPVGYATMFLVAPFVWLLMVSWLSAVVPDRIGAFVGRDALRRSAIRDAGE